MQSFHAKSRRRQEDDPDDSLSLPVSRTVEQHTGSYSRSNQHSNHSNTHKTSTSDRYRHNESSLNHHQVRDWRTDDGHHSRDRFNDDNYTHSRQDDVREAYNKYSNQDPKHTEKHSNQTTRHTHFTSSNRNWRYSEDTFATSSRAENDSWRDSSRYERIRDDRDEWIPNDASHEREKGRYEADATYSPRDNQSSRRGKERRYDDPERRIRNDDIDDHQGRPSKGEAQAEDRFWEPAASWKSRENHTQSKRSEGLSSRNANNKRNGKGYNNNRRSQHHQQRRDWQDDSGMNNWQKRDFSNTKTNTSVKRKQINSPSRSRSRSHSRSRSPAYSTRSFRSSIRSRSRSISPKRRRFDIGEHFVARASSRDFKSYRRYDRRSPIASAVSRRGDDGRGRPRPPSVTSSSSRSPSLSPARSKAKHRLPTTTTVRDIDLSAKSFSRVLPSNDREYENRQNGRQRATANRQTMQRPPRETEISPIERRRLPSPSVSHESMHSNDNEERRSKRRPPAQEIHDPGSPPVSNRPPYSDEDRTSGSPKFSRKKQGFKSIAKPKSSASVRKFFPGEDDESDIPPPRRQDSPSPVPPSGLDVRDETIQEDIPDDPRRRSEVIRHKNGSPLVNARQPTTSPHKDRAPPTERIIRPNDVSQLSYQRNDGENSHHDAAPTAIKKMLSGGVYGIVSQVGEGTFGQVYKAQNVVSGVYVALKRIRMEAERDGFPVTAMREIKLLQSLRHANVVQLYEMIVSQGSVYMVFEYMDHDLTGLLSQPQFVFTDAHLKSFCWQMLSGLAYLHHKGVIHRDIKGSNILINNRGELKLGDFGLARFYQKRRRSDYTNRVITLWYRPPELLFGTTVYGPEVDMWSAGCIMLELFCKKPVFQGNDEIHQLDVIYKVLGTPTPNDWPGLAELPWYELVKPKEVLRNHLREFFQKWLSPAGLDLAEQLLTFDPVRRVTAAQALEMSYFKEEDPPAEQPAGLSTLEGEWHEYESKRERAKKRRKLEDAQGGSEPQQ